MTTSQNFRNGAAILTLLLIASMGASSNVSARLSFDEGTGALVALLGRSCMVFLFLVAFMSVRHDDRHIGRLKWGWVIALGLLVTTQGLSMYSALARIPVALALLAVNSFPVILMLMNWVLNGRRPTPMALLLTAVMLVGLAIALEVPQRVITDQEISAAWVSGILFGLTAAVAFASTLWISEHKIAKLPGTTRNAAAMAVVIVMTVVLSQTGLLPDGMAFPDNRTGFLSLAALILFYTIAFCSLFLLAPRLNLARNAPVMNMEPIIAMMLAWWILDQALTTIQMAGAFLVLSGVVGLSRVR